MKQILLFESLNTTVERCFIIHRNDIQWSISDIVLHDEIELVLAMSGHSFVHNMASLGTCAE